MRERKIDIAKLSEELIARYWEDAEVDFGWYERLRTEEVNRNNKVIKVLLKTKGDYGREEFGPSIKIK